MKKRLFFVTLMLSFASLSWAYDFSAVAPSGQTLYYNITSTNTVTVTSQNGSYPYYTPRLQGTLTIPSSVTYNSQTYYVTTIGDNAFNDCYSLTSVTIPNSVTSIGISSFEYCPSLTSVIIPNSVTSIGNCAFRYCFALTTLTIPNSVTTIGDTAFYKCSALTSVTIPNSVTTIGDCAFRGCSGLTSVTIPDSVTTIGNYVFRDCTSLTSVTIPNLVTSIGEGAFSKCSALTSVTIPNSVTTIGLIAFDGCSSLTSVTIGNSVTSIGASAFWNCTSLTFVTIPNSVTSIGDEAFSYCSGLASISVVAGNTTYDSRDNCNAIIETSTNTLVCGCKNSIIPNSVTTIGDDAFRGCTGLTSITIPNSVISIGNSSFKSCSGLISVTIGNSVTSIGGGAFSYCIGLTSVTIPTSVTSINGGYIINTPQSSTISGDPAFHLVKNINYSGTATGSPWGALCVNGFVEDYLVYTNSSKTNLVGCSSAATSVTIPNSVISIGPSAFYKCSNLSSVTIPNSVTTIGDNAFYYCTGLISINIPNLVTSISDCAFSGCSSLISVTIPNLVTSIGNYAFYNCSGLSSVTIPNSVTSIGNYAFYRCSGLSSVTIPNLVTSIGSYAFYYCSSLTSVTIPNSVTSIGEQSFLYCLNLASVTMECNVPPALGTNAFDACPELTTIYVPCPSFNAYATATNWSRSSYRAKLVGEGPALNRTAEVTGTGTVNVSEVGDDNKVHVTVTPGDGFVFQSVGAKVYSCDGVTHLNDMILFEDEAGYWFNMPNDGLVKVSATFVETGLYTISTEAQLLAFATNINNGTIANGGQGLLYELTANIAITGTVPSIGTSTNPFRGIFHGNGYSVTLNGNALFGVTNGATIENVHIAIGSTVTATTTDSIGAVVNQARNNTIIRQCSNHGTVTGRNFVGGICGRLSNNSFLQDCWNTGAVSSVENAAALVGGLCGETYYSFVTYSFSKGNPSTGSSTNNAAGLVGRVWTSAVQYCYFDKLLTTASYIFRDYNAGSNIAYVGGRNTENLKGSALQDRLGASGHWDFVEDRYPELNVIASTPLANIAASPLNLYCTGVSFDRIDHVTQSFDPCWDYGTWSSDSPLITFDGHRAIVAAEGEPQVVTLTLTDGSLSHSVQLFVVPGGEPLNDPVGIVNPWDELGEGRTIPMTLHPNPATNSTTVQLPLDEGALQLSRLVIYNLQGQQVMEVRQPQAQQVLDLSTLPAGTYLVRLEGAYGTGMQKLVRQ